MINLSRSYLTEDAKVFYVATVFSPINIFYCLVDLSIHVLLGYSCG